MKLLSWALVALLVLVGVALLPMRDVGVTVAAPGANAEALTLPWLLPVVRVFGGLSLFCGFLLGWRTWRRERPKSKPLE